MLAHQFMRVERENDWILKQHCLVRMLPYLFVAGHHHCARYISWHVRDMQHIPLGAKAGSPQWFTRLPSPRRSCCGVRGPIWRADVYQTGENKRGD